MRCAFRQKHRMRDAPLLIQPEIGLLRKIRNAPFCKELWRNAFPGRFVGNVLGAFFAEFEMRSFAVGLGPGATGTINPLLLIELHQRARTAHKAHLAPRETRRSQSGSHTTRDFADWFA